MLVHNNEITFTKEEVQNLMIQAFVKGERWGVTYSGWFVPSENESAERAARDCEEIYKETLINKL